MKIIRKHIKELIALVLVLSFVSSLALFAQTVPNTQFGGMNRPDKDIESLESEKSDIEKTLEETKAQYKQEVKNYSKKEQELANIQFRIMDQIKLIEQTELDIENKQIEVSNKKLEVNKAKADVDNHIITLRKRLRIMYKFGKTGYLQIILKSDNLVNALTRVDRIRFLADYDKKMLNRLQFLQSELERKQKALEGEKEELEELKEDQTQQKEALQISYDQALVKKKEIANNMEALQRQKKQLEVESAKITETIRQMKIKRDYVGGQMAWPLDYNHRYITSYFGKRKAPTPGATTNHGAIDIAAPTGSNIYAALGGEVIYSGYFGSYGEMVLIDHGGGIHTLYAHASQRLVKEGQMVNRGDVVSRVGTTGRSTGPHLHFEVRENGTRVDPLNYVVQP